MSDDLKPCPFCGGEAEAVNYVIEAAVRCMDCRCAIIRRHPPDNNDDGYDVAIAAWNTRADAATIKAAVEMVATEHGWVRRERLETAADRIEELEREVERFTTASAVEIASSNNRVTEYMFHWEGRALDAEDKLTKAVEALRLIASYDFGRLIGLADIANTALAELEGKE